MLAVTIAVLPNQALIYAALVIAMLVEFPHLTLLNACNSALAHQINLSAQPPQ